MERVLGIDTGSNSLGWAIVERDERGCRLLEHGTNIFEEGVKIEKGNESSRAAERTEYRHSRRHYWRRKVRKISLLSILSDNHLCPPVSKGELRQWRLKKVYPMREDFLAWQRTDDDKNINPYRFRHICLTQKLDLSDLTQRYILGRALYHLNQRRGFLSNRKEGTKESDGKVISGIGELDKEIEKNNCTYLGEYFFHLYERGEKIRNHYTSRNSHYLKEFNAICAKQELDAELVDKLHRAIFYQRPLKSQKHLVGPCKFEPGKTRCPVSHPLFEDFRMYQLINNIKIQTPSDTELRPLSNEERSSIIPLFKRASNFEFKAIAKKLSGGKNKGFGFYKDEEDHPYKFNYPMDTPVSHSPVNKQLEDIFGEDWLTAVCEVYTLAGRKSRTEVMNDIWHVLFSFDDEEKLKEFAKNRLQLDDAAAEQFSKIKMPTDYAALSLNAIKKILFFMKDYGLRYDQAVLLGNLSAILPKYVWNLKETREAAIERAIDTLNEYDPSIDARSQDVYLKDYLKAQYGLDDKAVNKLWHHSDLETYPRARANEDGILQLGSPRVDAIKNPMAMRSLFRIKKVVNLLLKEGKIDADTKIHIEMGRDLNDANRRKAIQAWQRENEKENAKAEERIKEHFKERGIENYQVSDDDILKYRLWEEQNHKNIYGDGEEISMAGFLGENPKYDIEHTIPRSRGGDTTMANLTLCNSRYNRDVKKTKLPSELSDHEVILQRIEHWKKKYENFEAQYRKNKRGSEATKELKDSRIQRKHLAKIKYEYWKGKYERFTMTEVPEGFARRQGHDNSIVARYARMYLKSLFKQVYIVKGIATSDFRKIWGIQSEYEKKSRENHVHHCIDAITIACIGKTEYDRLAAYYHSEEEHKWYGVKAMHFPKPWLTFTEDMLRLEDELIIAHHKKDNLPKQTRKKIRNKDGKILCDKNKNPIYQAGDTARGALHEQTYYGAIERDGEIRYVVRKSLESLDEKQCQSIVDDEVKRIVLDTILKHGSLAKALEEGIWMNEEKHIPIKKVRIFTRLTRPLSFDKKKPRDKSVHEYKRNYYVTTERNYLMAIYRAKNEKGKEKSDFELVSALRAAEFYRKSSDKIMVDNQLVPLEKNGLPLLYKLKVGTMVLLYESSPEEVWDLTKQNLQKRLYKITGMSSIKPKNIVYGTLEMIHHQDARMSKEVKLTKGAFRQEDTFRSKIFLYHTQFHALVEGVDFEISELGEIKRLI